MRRPLVKVPTAEYVIYRKGMRKEDGIKVTIKMETK